MRLHFGSSFRRSLLGQNLEMYSGPQTIMPTSFLFTSESVAAGHPDKMCDNISDAILDACIRVDPGARVAVETFVKGLDEGSHIVIGGEVTVNSDAQIDYESIARATAAEIGYVDHAYGMNALDPHSCLVQVLISQQSGDISQGVTEGEGMFAAQGAGDQGIMFGYATNESERWEELQGALMPLPALLSQRLTRAMSDAHTSGTLPWTRPDSKSQVTVNYAGPGNPVSVDTVVVAIQHDDLRPRFGGDEAAEQSFIQAEIKDKIIRKVIPADLLTDDVKIIVNGTGRFEKGGPHADAGLTGRKIIVDTYGGMGRHGGGAFSGKDPSKVDRSAAYASRWAAKHVVAAGLAERCEIQLAYAIGVAEPLSVYVDTFGTNSIDESVIADRLTEAFDFRPAAIIQSLGLLRPIFARTSAGGHFGRDADDDGGFSWEQIDPARLAILRDD